jgi:hypothetical protein
MERCPVCGCPVMSTVSPSTEDGERAEVIGYHGRPPCWIAGYSVEYARAVGRILEQEGEKLRLAAHP